MVKLKEYTDKQLAQLQAELTLLADERRHEQNIVYQSMQDQINRRFCVSENELKAQEKSIDQRFAWVDDNTSKALVSMDARLQVMNEFRGAMADQNKIFISRDAVEKQFSAYEAAKNILIDRVTIVERNAANLQGRMWAIGVGISILSIVIGIALRFVH